MTGRGLRALVLQPARQLGITPGPIRDRFGLIFSPTFKATSSLCFETSIPTNIVTSASSIVRSFLVCGLQPDAASPSLPFEINERKSDQSAYLTHRLNRLKSCQRLPARPAQRPTPAARGQGHDTRPCSLTQGRWRQMRKVDRRTLRAVTQT